MENIFLRKVATLLPLFFGQGVFIMGLRYFLTLSINAINSLIIYKILLYFFHMSIKKFTSEKVSKYVYVFSTSQKGKPKRQVSSSLAFKRKKIYLFQLFLVILSIPISNR